MQDHDPIPLQQRPLVHAVGRRVDQAAPHLQAHQAAQRAAAGEQHAAPLADQILQAHQAVAGLPAQEAAPEAPQANQQSDQGDQGRSGWRGLDPGTPSNGLGLARLIQNECSRGLESPGVLGKPPASPPLYPKRGLRRSERRTKQIESESEQIERESELIENESELIRNKTEPLKRQSEQIKQETEGL